MNRILHRGAKVMPWRDGVILLMKIELTGGIAAESATRKRV
jgi:hypothetical protein